MDGLFLISKDCLGEDEASKKKSCSSLPLLMFCKGTVQIAWLPLQEILPYPKNFHMANILSNATDKDTYSKPVVSVMVNCWVNSTWLLGTGWAIPMEKDDMVNRIIYSSKIFAMNFPEKQIFRSGLGMSQSSSWSAQWNNRCGGQAENDTLLEHFRRKSSEPTNVKRAITNAEHSRRSMQWQEEAGGWGRRNPLAEDNDHAAWMPVAGDINPKE